MSLGGPDGELPLNLGPWLSIGPRDPFRIDFAIALDLPAAVLATVMSLATVCTMKWNRSDSADGSSGRLMYVAASLLLSSSLAIVMSTNVGELFVFWQIASVAAYLMMSSSVEPALRSGASSSVREEAHACAAGCRILVALRGIGPGDWLSDLRLR